MTRILSLSVVAALIGLSAVSAGRAAAAPLATATPGGIEAEASGPDVTAMDCAGAAATARALRSDASPPSLAGCCQRQGGVCGCRRGRATCCDGTPVGCPCHVDRPGPDTETVKP
jgi:hypothetical protein